MKIYHCRTKKGYDAYYVVYYLDGVRKMSSFAHFDKAKKEAEFVAQRMTLLPTQRPRVNGDCPHFCKLAADSCRNISIAHSSVVAR